MTTRPKAIECERCGTWVPVMSRGPVPHYCARCRKRGEIRALVSPYGAPSHDSREAQARALRSVTPGADRNQAPIHFNPMGSSVVLDYQLSLDRSEYEYHHRKTRRKRAAFTILWTVVAALIFVLMFVGLRPALIGGAALIFL